MADVQLIPTAEFNLAKLSEIALPENFDSAMAALTSVGITVENAAGVLADEWPLFEKAKLVNVPFVLLTWTVSNPDDSANSANGGQYLVCRGMTKDGRRFRFADGSTGIMAQLVKLTRERVDAGSKTPNAGLLVNGGLTKSDFTYTDPATGKSTPATTFYLSNAE